MMTLSVELRLVMSELDKNCPPPFINSKHCTCPNTPLYSNTTLIGGEDMSFIFLRECY